MRIGCIEARIGASASALELLALAINGSPLRQGTCLARGAADMAHGVAVQGESQASRRETRERFAMISYPLSSARAALNKVP